MKGYRETDVVSYAWNMGAIGLELNFWQKTPSTIADVWLGSKTSLIPPNHPDYFCERIIRTSRFFSMPELSATPSATWKIISNSSCHFQKVLGLLALHSMHWSLHFFLYIQIYLV